MSIPVVDMDLKTARGLSWLYRMGISIAQGNFSNVEGPCDRLRRLERQSHIPADDATDTF